jgi:uncharacterized membrane protein
MAGTRRLRARSWLRCISAASLSASPNRCARRLAKRPALVLHACMLRMLASLFVCLVAALPARAEFRVCNQSFDVINVAIGQPDPSGQFSTEGWWIIGTNQCARVVRDDLRNRYIYIHAADVFGQPMVDSDQAMCVADGKFRIAGFSDCWQRGFRAAPFVEVDTQAVDRWTLFLSPDADG